MRTLAVMAIGVTALAAISCGGGAGTPIGKRDAGDGGQGDAPAGHDGAVAARDGGATDAGHCPTPGELTAEPQSKQVTLIDGGVPIAGYALALAVARCSYWSRCFALSQYVANQCVDQLVNNDNSFSYPPSGVTVTYSDPAASLLRAAAAGVVHYDPGKEAECLAAELAEGCADSELIEVGRGRFVSRAHRRFSAARGPVDRTTRKGSP